MLETLIPIKEFIFKIATEYPWIILLILGGFGMLLGLAISIIEKDHNKDYKK